MGIIENRDKLLHRIPAAVKESRQAVFENAVKGVARELFYDPEGIVSHGVPSGEILPLKVMVDDLQFPVRDFRKVHARIVRNCFLEFDQL